MYLLPEATFELFTQKSLFSVAWIKQVQMLWLFQVRMPQNSPPFNLTFTLSSAVDWRLISCQPESNINFCGSPGNPIHAAQTKHWQMLLLSLWLINPRPHPTQDWTPARKLQCPEALADLSLMVQKQLAPVKWCWGPGRLCFHSVVPACRAPGESYSCFLLITLDLSSLNPICTFPNSLSSEHQGNLVLAGQK